jgi:redox-sensitive bicupin YhaK (pirin superfamily)
VGVRKAHRFLLLSAKPIGEPVARRGPFVMNSDEELQQAFDDYRSGRLVGG